MQAFCPPTAAVKTLGCKLNQFESQQIREQLVRLGCRIVPFESPADIYVINSCTVTARTDRDCRRLIRHAKSLNPQAFVAVTGCYAEVNPAELERIAEADLVVGNAGKGSLAQVIRERLADRHPWPEPESSPAPAAYGLGPMVADFADHTRAFVKVQEGCDGGCTYCIVPRARGPCRSVPPRDVVAQVERLVEAGHPEIVLIGIHLGKYGVDLPDGPDLAGLVERVSQVPGLGRLRLSSIEPREITPRLVDLVTGHPRVCRHLHVPMQSGCDSVLERMGRPYDSRFYAHLIEALHAREAGLCLGADVMVGFPGETEEEFAKTRELVRQLPLAYLHVFTYSRRPGTPAANMPGQVPREVALARNHELRELSEVKRTAFANSMVGHTLGTVFERLVADQPGLLDGLTDNYLRLRAPGPPGVRGTLQMAEVVGSQGAVLIGRIL